MGKYILVLFFFSCIYQFDGVQTDSPPVVLWHGMGNVFHPFYTMYPYSKTLFIRHN